MICDKENNCKEIYNPEQEDSDQNNIGDVCEKKCSQQDSDADGICFEDDNCPSEFNPHQEDVDNDGEGDVCDEDQDDDGLTNKKDNCPYNKNQDQNNRDTDGFGDSCEKNLLIVPDEFATIQEAIEAALPSQEILVRPLDKPYEECLQIKEKVALALTTNSSNPAEIVPKKKCPNITISSSEEILVTNFYLTNNNTHAVVIQDSPQIIVFKNIYVDTEQSKNPAISIKNSQVKFFATQIKGIDGININNNNDEIIEVHGSTFQIKNQGVVARAKTQLNVQNSYFVNSGIAWRDESNGEIINTIVKKTSVCLGIFTEGDVIVNHSLLTECQYGIHMYDAPKAKVYIENSIMMDNAFGIYEKENNNAIFDGKNILFNTKGDDCALAEVLCTDPLLDENEIPKKNSPAIDAAVESNVKSDFKSITRPQDGNGDGELIADIGPMEITK